MSTFYSFPKRSCRKCKELSDMRVVSFGKKEFRFGVHFRNDSESL